MIELLGGKVLRGPSAAGVHRHRAAAVVADGEVRGVVRIDPEIVVVAVSAPADIARCLPPVRRPEERSVLQVHDVCILRIGEDVGVVEGALANRPVLVDQRPGGAGVVTLEEASFVVLDEGVHPVRVGPRHRHADPPHDSRGQAGVTGDLGPGLAAIGALEKTAPRPAARHLVFFAVGLPHRRVHHVGVVAVDRDVDGRGLVVAVEHLAPGLAAIGTLEDTPLRVRHAVLPERGDENDFGVAGVDPDLGDSVGLGEADVVPGLAGIGALVHPIAGHDVAANAGLAHPDIHDVGIGFAHRDRADRCASDLSVSHRSPVLAAVGRLPQSAADRAEVRLLRTALHPAHGDGTAAAVGADVPPAVGAKQRGVGGGAGKGEGGKGEGGKGEGGKGGLDQRESQCGRQREHQ